VSDEQSQTATSSGADVEALVARYAPIGRQLRRRRQLSRLALALLLPVLGVAAAVMWQSRDVIVGTLTIESDADRIERALNEFRDLKASLKAETGAVAAQRAELARQQEIFGRHNEQLATQLVAINAQRESLAAQSRQFEEQQASLATAIEKADEQRRSLQASTGSKASIDRQLLEIARQKRSLEEQQQQFLEQGQALAREIGEINRQRIEIERQRQTIEQQQAEVRKLLEQINTVGAERQRQRQESAARAAEEQLLAADAPPDLIEGKMATMAAVGAEVLGEMRGGVDLGLDYSFAIGITRTTSINGIEQFSSAMYINELGAAHGTGAPTQTLQLGEPMIIQNGPGNFVDAGLLSSPGLSSATIIQNTLDNQTITNELVLDVSLQNVSTMIQGMDLSRIARDGLNLPQ